MKNNFIMSFFVGVREEIKKIAWPSRQKTIQTTIIVVVATLLASAYIGLVDYGLSYLIQKFIIK